ncbi:tripartite tricarboxylate transporter TctB family protein [Rhodovulum sp. 12E13]|uniref:tripartite tricarboxylate transporter TctB family protein n=1 Tax=Rhodovulum sp. 12E13 TaxID=2203891 RepID=UPI000E13F752|nr:tripartite tricarboxylate transporter TctB family protein [Rhodovulum sp. 12E13]RDC71242.1 tripartite tricarboxylate transporter TctB family protein [Rhodovulum sp. 12E13]
MPSTPQTGSVVPPLLVILLGAGALWAAMGIRPGMLPNDPGPAFLPMAAGAALVGLGLRLLVAREPHDGMPRGAMLLRVAGTIGLTLAYLATLERWGFPASTFAFLTCQMVLLGVRSPLALATLPAGLTALTYLLFRVLLSVPLPATRIGGMLI